MNFHSLKTFNVAELEVEVLLQGASEAEAEAEASLRGGG